jgi:hypothetical protein
MADTDEWVSVAEAARRLGITDTAVRKRMRTGSIRFRKVLNRTEIEVPNQRPESSQPVGNGSEPGSQPVHTPLERHLLEQIAVKDRQIAELHRLMLADKQELVELRQRLALPPVPQESFEEPKEEPERGRKAPWWHFWKREKA